MKVVIPAAQGRAEGKEIAVGIEALLENGTEMEVEGFVCYMIGEPAQYAGVPTTTRFTIPVSMNYRIDNRN